MLAKLTLTIERDIIKRAKLYAQEKNESVSRMVEDYLRNISAENGSIDYGKRLESPITDSLVGMFADNGKDYKTMLEEALSEKFL